MSNNKPFVNTDPLLIEALREAFAESLTATTGTFEFRSGVFDVTVRYNPSKEDLLSASAILEHAFRLKDMWKEAATVRGIEKAIIRVFSNMGQSMPTNEDDDDS